MGVKKVIGKKDTRTCYGLLSEYEDELEIVEKEAFRARKQKH
jgi:hypothetical protein